jgi:ribose 5-phosphate isomerase B
VKVAVGSDERTATTDAVVLALSERGIEVDLYGPLNDEAKEWAEVSEEVAIAVSDGSADAGVLFCWTGTGCSIAANKVDGIRAALCADAETAQGARRYNDANVLAISLRLTTPEAAREILGAFLDTTEVDPTEIANVEWVRKMER